MRESLKMKKDYKNEFYVDGSGVVRWNSNDQVPFDDMLTQFLIEDLIDSQTVVNSMKTRKTEAAISIQAYVDNRKQYGYSDEEKFEMRAAFGDEEVVDLFTNLRVRF